MLDIHFLKLSCTNFLKQNLNFSDFEEAIGPADYRVIQSNGKTIVIIMDPIGFSYRIHKRGSKNQTWCCPKRKKKSNVRQF